VKPLGESERPSKRIIQLPKGNPLIVPPEPRRLRPRDYTPTSVKNWATNIIDFLPERDSEQILQSSISLAYTEAMHNQVLITNNAGATVFPLFQRATLVDDLSISNLLPQYTSGANVGIDETDFVVIGPYNALYAKTETDPIANNQFADQLYVLNVDATPATHVIICQIRVRFFLDTGGSGS
jgi:hypothetical protein